MPSATHKQLQIAAIDDHAIWVRCMTLDSRDANVHRKWESAWLDPTHADSVPLTPSDTEGPAESLSAALPWGSAAMSYGRVEESHQRRKIDLTALFIALGIRGLPTSTT